MADLLTQITTHFSKIGLPLLVFVSFFGNVLNIAVLSRYKLRKYPCTLYFIALSMNNLIYSTTILIISLLGDGYRIRISIQSSLFCKLVTYFGTILSALAPSFIVLASIDRWFASSSVVQRRNLSHIHVVKWSIFTVTTFFLLLFIISLVTADVDTNDSIGCRIQGSTFFVKAYGIFQFILFSCLAPCLMSLFGCMTIRNIKRNRMLTVVRRSSRRIEKQLFQMLLVQVVVQLLFTVPMCIVGLLLSLPGIYQPTTSFYSVFLVCRVIFQFTYAVPFFLYIVSAHTFRKDCIQLLIKLPLCRFHNRIHVS